MRMVLDLAGRAAGVFEAGIGGLVVDMFSDEVAVGISDEMKRRLTAVFVFVLIEHAVD